MNEARAFWVAEPGRGEIRAAHLPAAGEGEVVVRALFSGVSRGTESLVFSGHIPPSEYQRMRAPFQEGEFPGPVKFGYSSVGLVEAGPSALLGRSVFCLYPHQTRYVVPAAALELVPPGVPPERAVLAANLETALNGLWDSGLKLGDHLAVIGGGTVGCLVAWLATRVPGCHVELIDLSQARAATAAALGVRFATPGTAQPEADCVVHASGSAEGLRTALSLAGPEATVVELSWYGDREVPVPLGGAFHARRLTLRSSQVGQLNPSQQPRWTRRRRLALALELLADPRLDALISGETPFSGLPDQMARLATGDALCHRIRYD
jgi:threonine dehydrogenase-like Zn-dependent dehydrogenase